MISFRLRKDFPPSATSVKRGSSRSRRGRSSRTWTPSVSRWHQASQTVNLGQTVLDDLLHRKSIAARQVLADACLGGGHRAAGQERGKNKASYKKNVKMEKCWISINYCSKLTKTLIRINALGETFFLTKGDRIIQNVEIPLFSSFFYIST